MHTRSLASEAADADPPIPEEGGQQIQHAPLSDYDVLVVRGAATHRELRQDAGNGAGCDRSSAMSLLLFELVEDDVAADAPRSRPIGTITPMKPRSPSMHTASESQQETLLNR